MTPFYPPAGSPLLQLKDLSLSLLAHGACKFSSTKVTSAKLWGVRGAGCWAAPLNNSSLSSISILLHSLPLLFSSSLTLERHVIKGIVTIS